MTKTHKRKQGALRKLCLMAVLMLIAVTSVQAQTVLTADQLQNGQAVELDKLGWKYSPNDDPRFADPQFDDRAWATLKDSTKPQASESGWQGIGWFRLHLRVPNDLSGVSLNLELSHLGASEIYLDGIRRGQFGVVGKTQAEEQAYNPNAEPLGLIFQEGKEHVLAVRYSNQQTANQHSFLSRWMVGMEPFMEPLKVTSGSGFRSRLKKFGALTNQGYYRAFTWSYLVFNGAVFLSFGVLHLLLFFFFSTQRSNLFSGLLLLSLALNGFCLAYGIGGHYALLGFYLNWQINSFGLDFMMAAYLAFLYVSFRPKAIRPVWLFIAVGVCLRIFGLLGWGS